MDHRNFLASLPLLHSWDGGKTWNAGGFAAEHLQELFEFCRKNLPPRPTILETGAGNSTICFLHLDPRVLVSIEMSGDLFERINDYCIRFGIPLAAHAAITEESEWALPKMALSKPRPEFDFVLIDGSHNWPLVFVDFCYGNYMLKQGGFIMLDDIHLHTVRELALMLREHPGFVLEKQIGKSLIYRRTDARRGGYEWQDSPYIVRRTQEIERSGKRFTL